MGQGLAGTSMAMRLLKEGKSILIIDECKPVTASLISSGLINPITGRRCVKSWMFDELLPEAIQFYRDLESCLGETFCSPKIILRGLSNALEENIWMGQSTKQDYSKYFGNVIASEYYNKHFKNDILFGEVKDSYQVKISALILSARKHFINQKCFLNYKSTIDDFTIGRTIIFKDYEADSVIFAEGWKVIVHPLFKNLPFEPTKGEVSIASLESYHLSEAIKNKMYIIPLNDGRFYIGSTNENNISNDFPNKNKQAELDLFMDEYLNTRYEIKERLTAIRSSTEQRRPIIGAHPEHNNVFLFNGLGAKGASLAPYFSKMLTAHILYKYPIIKEVNINYHNHS